MRKYFNYRPIVFCAVTLLLGMFFAYLIFCEQFSIYGLTIFVLSILLLMPFKQTREICVKYFKTCMVIILFFVFGFSLVYIKLNIESKSDFVTGEYVISARVKTISNFDSFSSLVLDNVEIYSGDNIISKNSGNMSIYLPISEQGNNKFETGTKFLFKSKVSNCFYIEDDGEFNSFFYYNDIKFKSIGQVEVLSVYLNPSMTIDEKIRLAYKDVIFENMGNEVGPVAYAMMFGDNDEVLDEVYSVFQQTGLLHLFAVSGLHVGFFIMLIGFLLSKLKTNQWLNFSILFFVVLVYAWLCGFSPSVCRASIMGLVLSYSMIRHKPYDSLNALSISIIIILLFSPLGFVTKQFVLSICAVLGIILFSRVLTKVFSKLFAKDLASFFAVSISAQIGILPFYFGFFGGLNPLSILTNFIVIPIAGLAYMALFVVSTITLFLNVSYAFIGIKWLFGLMLKIATTLKFAYFQIGVSSFLTVSVITFIVGMFALSDYINIKLKYKYIVSILLFSISAVFLLI